MKSVREGGEAEELVMTVCASDDGWSDSFQQGMDFALIERPSMGVLFQQLTTAVCDVKRHSLSHWRGIQSSLDVDKGDDDVCMFWMPAGQRGWVEIRSDPTADTYGVRSTEYWALR